jgi:hypothetical protein
MLVAAGRRRPYSGLFHCDHIDAGGIAAFALVNLARWGKPSQLSGAAQDRLRLLWDTSSCKE